MFRPLHFLVLAAIIVAASSARAQQLPALLDVPPNVAAARPSLPIEYDALQRERVDLHGKVTALNSDCSAIDERQTAKVAACTGRRNELRAALTRHIERSNAFNAAVKLAMDEVPQTAVLCKTLNDRINQMNVVAGRASLAQDVYSFYEQTRGWLGPWKAPPGFTLLSNDINEDRRMFRGLSDLDIADLLGPAGSSYRAAIYRDDKTKTVFLVFRGSTEQGEDWSTNIANELNLWPLNFEKARLVAYHLKASTAASGQDLEIIGHSLGGGLAIAAALATRTKATVFNAEFASNEFEADASGDNAMTDRSVITNYVTPGEALTGLQKLTGAAQGNMIVLPAWPGAPLSTLERHKMSNVRLAIQNQLKKFKDEYAAAKCSQ